MIPQAVLDLPHPGVILEVGANDGEDTRAMLERWPGVQIHCFEPDARARGRFRAPEARLYPTAVGALDGEVTFHESSGLPYPLPQEEAEKVEKKLGPNGWDFSGSIRAPKNHLTFHPWCKFVSTTTVPITRLDTWARQFGLLHQPVGLIWADVQGAEGDLIAGAPDVLRQTRYLFTEFSNDEMYEGQLTLPQLLAVLPGWEVVEQYREDVLLRNTR